MAVVVIPEALVTINQWRGTGWAVIDPYTGLGAYIIAGGMYYANATAPPQILSGGWGTVPVNMSLIWEKFVNYSDELEEWLHLSNVTKREAAKQVVISLVAPPAVPISYLAVLASIQEFGIGTLTLGGAIGIAPVGLAAILLMIPLILYFYFVVLPPAKLWYDPAGMVYIAGE